MRQSKGGRFFTMSVLGALYLWSLLPIALIVLSSLKPTSEIFLYPPNLIFSPTLDNYRSLFAQWPEFTATLQNSAIIAGGATVITVISSALAGYVLSRFRSSGIDATALFMVAIRLVPPIVITLPLFPIVGMLGLSDTHILLILLYTTFFVSLGAMILKTFIDTIPKELDESAIIDGAGEVSILLRIIFPLAAQGMVAIAVFIFVFAWNDYLFAFIFTTSNAKTAPIIISEMLGSLVGVEWGPLFAAATVQLIPVLIFVVLAQKFLVAGLTAGSVKG